MMNIKFSKNKFDKLKYNSDPELNLDFYLNNINPKWEEYEWGFPPKGWYKNINESNIQCAEREFIEETGVDKFILFNNEKTVNEQFIGTNANPYRHVYYLGYINDNIKLEINKNNLNQFNEIGNIGYFTYEKSIKLIRPYHYG